MRLFLRDQLSLIAVYFAQLVVVTSVYWLDGYADIWIGLYACLLSGSLLLGYLAVRYFNNRSFYSALENPAKDALFFPDPQSLFAELAEDADVANPCVCNYSTKEMRQWT